MIEDSMSEDLLPYLRLRHLGAADAFLLEAIFRQARPVAMIALGDTIRSARHSAAHNWFTMTVVSRPDEPRRI